MRKLLTLLISATLFISLIGCDDTTSSSDTDISGKWAGSSMSGTVQMKMTQDDLGLVLLDTTITMSENLDTTMLFKITGDKIYMYQNMGSAASVDSMQYSISGSTVTIINDDGTSENSTVTVSGGTMTMTMSETETETEQGVTTVTTSNILTTLKSYSGDVPPSDWPEIQ